MKKEPNPLAAVLILIWIVFMGYYAYRSWFDPNGLRESLRRDVERLPSWYAIKDYTLSRLNGPVWLWQMRILSTLGTLVGAVFFILIIYLIIQ